MFWLLTMVKAGKLGKINKIMDLLDPMNHLTKFIGKGVNIAFNRVGKGFKYVINTAGKNFKRYELRFKIDGNTLYCGIPNGKISIIDKLKQADIEKLPVDENGIRIADIDGEAIPIGNKKNIETILYKTTKLPKLGEKLNVSEYGISAKNSAKDKMTPDHIPSFAALKKYLENKLGRKLRPHEITQYYNDATTILYETSLHQKYSRTYGGRNTAEQIAEDAQDLYKAAQKDMETLKKHLLDSGASESDIEKAFELIHEMNRKKGLY